MPHLVRPMVIRDLVEELTSVLECTQKSICSLIGITPTSLSTSMEKPIRDFRDSKVTKRLLSLMYVVSTLTKDQSLNASLIMKVLVAPCYLMQDETYMDVVSAIHDGSFKNEHLIDIADAALKKFRSQYETDKRPPRNSLYEKATTGHI